MSFLNKKRFFLLLIGFIIVVGLIGFSLNDRDNLSTPEKFIKDSVGWTQNIIYTPIKYVMSTFTDFVGLKDVQKENKLLKDELSETKALSHEVQELTEENEELRKTLEKTEGIRDFNPIQASVMGRSPERWIEQITINKGKQHGIKNNMAVITADGMVGKIQNVSEFTSTVQLLTGFDQFNRISATISKKKGKDIVGLVEEFDKESNSLLFRIIEESSKSAEEGDLVVSSGMGGVFPSGLLIGTVKEVVPDQYGLTSTALLESAADTYSIKHVIVVDRILESEDETSDEQESEE